MQTETTASLEQIGGWFNLQIFTTDELIKCPDVVTNKNSSSIVIEPSTTSLDILPVAENIKITESTRSNKNGTYYSINAEADFYIQKKDIDSFFYNHLHKKVVLVGIKHYGQQKMYGSKKFPLDFSYQHINGKKLQDGSLVKIKVTGKIPQKPVFIND